MKNNKMHSVRYNFIMNFILTSSQFLFPLITFPYISRVLQAGGNGKLSFVASVANYFSMVASLGIPTYGVRACAQVRDDREKLSKTVNEIFRINLLMTIIVLITYTICVFTIPRFYTDKTLFFIYGINIFLNMFGMNWVFQALEQYDYITFRSLLFKLISLFLMFALVHKQEDYIVYSCITIFASVGSNILNFVRIRKYIDFKIKGSYEFKKHIRPILTLFAQSLAVSIYTNLDTVMLGFIKTDVEVGYYNAAVKLKSILLSLVSSLGSVLLPRMSYFVKNQMKEQFNVTMLKALNFTMLLAMPLALFFVLFSKEVILLLAGDGYLGSVTAMKIITIAIIPNGLTGILGVQVLTSLEKEKYVLYSVVIGAITDFILNIFFIKNYGATGAALATMIAEYIVLGVQLYYTRNLIAEIYKGLLFRRYVILSLISSILGFCTKLLNIPYIFLELLISSIVFGVSYLLLLIVIKEPIVIDTFREVKCKIRKK